MGKASALLSFLYLFPSEHSFFAPILAILCGPPALLHKYFLLGWELHVYKLQTWAFKPETVRLRFLLDLLFHEQCVPMLLEWMSSFTPVQTQTAMCCFLVRRARGFFPQLLFNSLGQVFLFLVAVLFYCS